MEGIMSLVSSFGTIGIVIYLLFKTLEENKNKDSRNQFLGDKITNLVERTTSVIENNNEVLKNNTEAVNSVKTLTEIIYDNLKPKREYRRTRSN